MSTTSFSRFPDLPPEVRRLILGHHAQDESYKKLWKLRAVDRYFAKEIPNTIFMFAPRTCFAPPEVQTHVKNHLQTILWTRSTPISIKEECRGISQTLPMFITEMETIMCNELRALTTAAVDEDEIRNLICKIIARYWHGTINFITDKPSSRRIKKATEELRKRDKMQFALSFAILSENQRLIRSLWLKCQTKWDQCTLVDSTLVLLVTVGSEELLDFVIELVNATVDQSTELTDSKPPQSSVVNAIRSALKQRKPVIATKLFMWHNQLFGEVKPLIFNNLLRTASTRNGRSFIEEAILSSKKPQPKIEALIMDAVEDNRLISAKWAIKFHENLVGPVRDVLYRDLWNTALKGTNVDVCIFIFSQIDSTWARNQFVEALLRHIMPPWSVTSSILHYALRSGILDASGTYETPFKKRTENTPLLVWVIRSNKTELVSVVLEEIGDFRSYKYQEEAVCAAIKTNEAAIFQQLLDVGADPECGHYEKNKSAFEATLPGSDMRMLVHRAIQAKIQELGDSYEAPPHPVWDRRRQDYVFREYSFTPDGVIDLDP